MMLQKMVLCICMYICIYIYIYINHLTNSCCLQCLYDWPWQQNSFGISVAKGILVSVNITLECSTSGQVVLVEMLVETIYIYIYI